MKGVFAFCGSSSYISPYQDAVFFLDISNSILLFPSVFVLPPPIFRLHSSRGSNTKISRESHDGQGSSGLW